jgi:hypothetical protein
MDTYEKRQDRIEDAIEKLTVISADLNRMVAVHEQRLLHQEKIMVNIEDIIERRRQEFDNKFINVYDKIEYEDKKILLDQENMKKKISALEKIIWSNAGGIAILSFIIAYGEKFVKFL